MKYIGIAIIVIIGLGLLNAYVHRVPEESDAPGYACSKEAKVCADGSVVGRSGPACEFEVCPELPAVPADVQAHIDSKADLVTIAMPAPGSVIQSPLEIHGEARGYWFFEASFPVTLTDWDGKIIAQHYAMTAHEWMTEDFVPYSSTLTFESPYNAGDPEFMRRGTLILQRDNPSGLPENDNALEIPVLFQ